MNLNKLFLVHCQDKEYEINQNQIDIIDKSYNYSRWTKHFRNYNCIYRDNFTNLSKEILQLI